MNQKEKDLYLAKLYTARANGEVIQEPTLKSWIELDDTKLIKHWHRIKPKTRIINGIEVPDCLRVKPKLGEIYYVERICAVDLYQRLYWNNDSYGNNAFNREAIYATAEDAISNCKARYGVDE